MIRLWDAHYNLIWEGEKLPHFVTISEDPNFYDLYSRERDE